MSLNPLLTWTAGSGASSRYVYFGSSDPPAFVGNQAPASYQPGTLFAGRTYYWRIDEKNDAGTTTGSVWNFSTDLSFIVSPVSLSILEGGTASFTVSLGGDPGGTVEVSVVRASGDEDITIQAGSSLTFNSSNYDVPQTVTLAAAADCDATNGQAVIQVSAAGATSATVTVEEIDSWSGLAWVQRFPANKPSARKYHAMAYDLNRQTVVLFGGLTGAGDDNQTWEWDGAAETWTRIYPYSSPPAQHGHAMLGELSTPTIVGSYGGQMYNWMWDSTLPEWWGSPMLAPQRQRAGVFCETSGLGYLFGGQTPTNQALDDTWMFSGYVSEVLLLEPSPPARWGQAMDTSSFDSTAPAILFGGENGQTRFEDTWAFWGGDLMLRTQILAATGQTLSGSWADPIALGGGGGGGWVELNPTVSPSPRSDARMAQGVLFGGHGDLEGGGEGHLGDTWVFANCDQPTWHPLSFSGPTPASRRGHAMVWDPVRNVIVLFGGETPDDLSDETWELDLNN